MELTWLGQAGFVLGMGEHWLCVDPYLSDLCGRLGDNWRLYPPPRVASNLDVDTVLITHEHPDHLDRDTVGGIARSNPEARFIAPLSCVSLLIEHGVPGRQCTPIARGQEIELTPAVRVRAVVAHHTHDSVGYVIRAGGSAVYISGDTSYGADIADEVGSVDTALVCINGRLGNLSPNEAAVVCRDIGVRRAVPMHYGLFPRNTIDPAEFADALDAMGLATAYLPLEVGQAVAIDGADGQAALP